MGTENSTQNSNRASVFRAVRFIEERLSNPPSVDEVAAAASISVSHLHRVFPDVVGESVSKHILRLRLERSATLLRYSDWQSGEIGLACGFETASSYCRGFKRLYGMTPESFRHHTHTQPFLKSEMRCRPEREQTTPKGPLPTVRIESWKAQSLICLRHYGAVNEIMGPWKELLTWARKNLPRYEEARFFGLWFDDWSELGEDKYRYDCALLPSGEDQVELPEPLYWRELPAGSVAISYVKGSLTEIERAWEIFGTSWLPSSGLQPRLEFAFDEYSSQEVLSHPFKQLFQFILGKREVNLCIPVQNKSAEIYLD